MYFKPVKVQYFSCCCDSGYGIVNQDMTNTDLYEVVRRANSYEDVVNINSELLSKNSELQTKINALNQRIKEMETPKQVNRFGDYTKLEPLHTVSYLPAENHSHVIVSFNYKNHNVHYFMHLVSYEMLEDGLLNYVMYSLKQYIDRSRHNGFLFQDFVDKVKFAESFEHFMRSDMVVVDDEIIKMRYPNLLKLVKDQLFPVPTEFDACVKVLSLLETKIY